MRDPKRIKRILTKIESIWTKYPDLRLGQLIEILHQKYAKDRDLFCIEDDELEKFISSFEKDYS